MKLQTFVNGLEQMLIKFVLEFVPIPELAILLFILAVVMGGLVFLKM